MFAHVLFKYVLDDYYYFRHTLQHNLYYHPEPRGRYDGAFIRARVTHARLLFKFNLFLQSRFTFARSLAHPTHAQPKHIAHTVIDLKGFGSEHGRVRRRRRTATLRLTIRKRFRSV